MIKLSSTWYLPDTELPDTIDRRYFEVHVPGVRRLPGLRRHQVLKAIPIGDALREEHGHGYGEHPRVWRGEDLWFDSREDFDAAVASPEWKALAADGFSTSARQQSDLFEIVEEYRTPDAAQTGDVTPGRYVVDRGTWHIPDDQLPEEIDRYYFGVHVPNVRGLTSIHRHVVLKAVAWPGERHPRCWRGADCWKDSRRLAEDRFPADDVFVEMLAGLEFDRFAVEQEWTPEAAR